MEHLSQPEVRNEVAEEPDSASNGELLTVLERSHRVTLAFLAPSSGRMGPGVLEWPYEGKGEAESKFLARLGKTV